MKRKNLPNYFEPLFWGLKFSSIDPQKHKRGIIVKTINAGRWEHWKWLVDYYGKRSLRKSIINIPKSEFRESALRLISNLLGIKELKYETRSDYIADQR